MSWVGGADSRIWLVVVGGEGTRGRTVGLKIGEGKASELTVETVEGRCERTR